jgi:hypothetical protein
MSEVHRLLQFHMIFNLRHQLQSYGQTLQSTTTYSNHIIVSKAHRKIIDTHVHHNLDPFFPTWKTYWDEAQDVVKKALLLELMMNQINAPLPLRKTNQIFMQQWVFIPNM